MKDILKLVPLFFFSIVKTPQKVVKFALCRACRIRSLLAKSVEWKSKCMLPKIQI